MQFFTKDGKNTSLMNSSRSSMGQNIVSELIKLDETGNLLNFREIHFRPGLKFYQKKQFMIFINSKEKI